jgi:hypothetical protein
MSNWALGVNHALPYAFIQWKGTDACMDINCVCGHSFHLDESFLYAVQCAACKRRYEVSAVVELREMPPKENWDGILIKESTESTDVDEV